jgi:kynurenine 3-monooxygenase
MLAARGLSVTLYERRDDPRVGHTETGRSINLALAARGLHALERAGLRADIEDLLVPMRGRLLHATDGSTSFMPYGRKPDEFIWSISRRDLNDRLLSASQRRGVRLRFNERCSGVDYSQGRASFQGADDRISTVPFSPSAPLLATDGARSAVRTALQSAGFTSVKEDVLSHAYKELLLPAGPQGEYLIAKEVLHIWPRGNYMLIALPNTDGSFTVTLFLERQGAYPSFDSLNDEAAIQHFFNTQFADAAALMPDVAAQFMQNPTGSMSTIQTSQWSHPSGALLLGDAAHAIVPFHGQGMNCAFEDCAVIDEQLAAGLDWPPLLEQFTALRQKNTDAIARMAIENYEEMSNTVRDPHFALQKQLSAVLEERHPDRFIPRYSMVSFHAEIPYAEAERRGAIQQNIVREALTGQNELSAVDYQRIDAAVLANLDRLI